jgi:predicted metal-binding membrane protein
MARSEPLSLERSLVLGLLLALAAAAWALLLWERAGGAPDMAMAAPTMGLRAPLFLAIWVVMMVAMMFPTAAPMILAFHKIQEGKRRQGGAFVSTWVFVAAYLLVWALSGLLAYAGALGAEAVAAWAALSPEAAARIGGVAILAAGLYQLTPLKALCLAKCRSPLAFIMTSWREGAWGALRMGLVHGFYCLGCCWLLFVVLFPLGIMNIAAMAAVTLVIFAEKALPWSVAAARATAAALLLYGAAVIAAPSLLPTFTGAGMEMGNMEMPGMRMPMPGTAAPAK